MSAASSVALLRVAGVSHRFGSRSPFTRQNDGVQALDNVSLTVHQGRAIGVVGESGSGKTTLARAIIGLLKPDAGSITFDGTELTSLSENGWRHVRTRVQMVYQDPYTSLNPALTVRQALIEPLLVHRLADKTCAGDRVEELMAQVGLSRHLAARRPSQLSGGQRQRVAIARALAVGPELLIADEAVSALDVSVQAQVLRLLSQLREDLGLTLVFVSHQLATVAQICDDVVIMKHGEIVEQGPTQAVFDAPTHAYTRALMHAHPGLERSGVRSGGRRTRRSPQRDAS